MNGASSFDLSGSNGDAPPFFGAPFSKPQAPPPPPPKRGLVDRLDAAYRVLRAIVSPVNDSDKAQDPTNPHDVPEFRLCLDFQGWATVIA